jgi:hypothetical protein
MLGFPKFVPSKRLFGSLHGSQPSGSLSKASVSRWAYRLPSSTATDVDIQPHRSMTRITELWPANSHNECRNPPERGKPGNSLVRSRCFAQPPGALRGKRKAKPHVTPEQFEQLLELIQEPYASMAFVAVWTGLRASELIGLKCEDVGADSLTINERSFLASLPKPCCALSIVDAVSKTVRGRSLYLKSSSYQKDSRIRGVPLPSIILNPLP